MLYLILAGLFITICIIIFLRSSNKNRMPDPRDILGGLIHSRLMQGLDKITYTRTTTPRPLPSHPRGYPSESKDIFTFKDRGLEVTWEISMLVGTKDYTVLMNGENIGDRLPPRSTMQPMLTKVFELYQEKKAQADLIDRKLKALDTIELLMTQ